MAFFCGWIALEKVKNLLITTGLPYGNSFTHDAFNEKQPVKKLRILKWLLRSISHEESVSKRHYCRGNDLQVAAALLRNQLRSLKDPSLRSG
jgi:hypothetical protein